MNNFTLPLSKKTVMIALQACLFSLFTFFAKAQAVYTTVVGDWTQSWNSNSGSYQAAGGPGIYSFGSDANNGQVNTRLLTSDGTTSGTQQPLRVGQKLIIRLTAPVGDPGGGNRTGIQTNGRIGFSLKSSTGFFDGSSALDRHNLNSLLQVEYKGGTSTAQFVSGDGVTTSGMPNFTDFVNGITYVVEMISDKEFNLELLGGTRYNVKPMMATGTIKQISIVNLGNNRDAVYTLVEVANTSTVTLISNTAEFKTVTGVISDNGVIANTVTKSGAGTVTFTGQNTYTGSTTISNGTLVLNGASANTINAGNDIFLSSGGTLQISQNQTVGNLVVPAGSTLIVDAGKTLTITGSFSGGGTITNNGTISMSGTFPQNFPGAGTVTAMNNLVINNNSASGVTLNSATLTVTGTLSFAANGGIKSLFSTGSNTVIASTVTGASAANGWVNGNLRKPVAAATNYDFAVGTATTYAPASISFSSVGVAGSITVRTNNGASANYPSVFSTSNRLARYWTVTNSGVGSFTASATFNYNPADLVGAATQSSVKPYKFDGPSTFSYPASSTGTNSFTQTGLTSFSEFGAGECETITVAPVTGTPTTICVGATTQYLNATPGGVWSSDDAGKASVDINGLVTGVSQGSTLIRYIVTDISGCSGEATPLSVTVNANSTITLSSLPATQNQTVCNGALITPVTFTVTGGTGASITVGGLPSGVTGSYSGNTFTISGTAGAPGSFSYTITTSGSGCTEAQISGAITVQGSLAATYTKTNLSSCAMVNDGSITVSPTGGSGSYTYSWTGATGPGNPAPMNFTAGNVNPLTGLTFGDYNVTVTDAGGCGSIVINTIHIEYAFLVHITHSGTNANSCGGSTGSVILYGSAGVQPYTYSLVPGSNAPAGTYVAGSTFTGLAAGNYTGWIKDAAGCAQSRNITVAAAPALLISPFVRNASSCSPDGSIEIYRSGGIPPYTYALDALPYQPGNVFTGLAAGSHTAYVKDGANCITSTTVTVTAGAGLFPTAYKTNTSTCVNDGTIQLNANGGGVGPYTYKLNVAPYTSYQSGNSFTGLANGNYVGTVKDSKGCTGTVNVTINLSPITVSSTVTNATSCVSTDGKIQLFRTGGVGPFTYSIDGGNTFFASNVFTGLTAGSYDCYVKDSKFCTASQLGVVVGPNCDLFAGNVPVAKGNSHVTKVTATPAKVNAYPNPSATEFTIVLEGFTSAKVNITVTDIMGRKVYQTEGAGKQQYHFGSKFIAGIYNVQVVQGDKKQSLKLVKE